MSQTHDEIRALRVMVDELRAEPPPDRPWDAIEQRLLARIDRDELAPVRSLHGRHPVTAGTWVASDFSRVIGFAAAAAVLAFGVGSMSRSAELASSDAPPRHVVQASAVAQAPGDIPAGAHDLSRLAVGDVIEAGDAPVTFAQAGLVAWTLAPGSTVRVSSVGVGHTVVLERGAIRAEVTPRAASEGLVEAFAVEVAGTRVAVHGTAFSVKLEGDRAVVDVEHGTVAVGPRGHVGVTTGHMLVGPSRASFSLDGGRSARLLDRLPDHTPDAFIAASDASPRAPAEPVAVALAGAPSAAAAPGEVPPADHAAARPIDGAIAVAAPRHAGRDGGDPRAPGAAARTPAPAAQPVAAPPEPPRLTVDIVRGRIERCFRQQSDASRESGASTLHIDPISTTLSIDLNPDGTSRSARFTTRIKPELVLCAGTAISGRFADGLGHVDIPVTFQP